MPTKVSASHHSVKHDIISKNNTRTVAAVAVATFVVIFCAFALRSLFSQSLYHGRVIGEKEKALRQLEENKDVLNTLARSYQAFVTEQENILGGNPSGQGPLDGDNAKIVLDALPGKYDHPALSSSFEKILKGGGYDIDSIGGTEDSGIVNTAVGKAEPMEILYSFSFSANADRTEALINTLERSIRPMSIDRFTVQSSDGSNLRTQITLRTYFTHASTFELGSKEVK